MFVSTCWHCSIFCQFIQNLRREGWHYLLGSLRIPNSTPHHQAHYEEIPEKGPICVSLRITYQGYLPDTAQAMTGRKSILQPWKHPPYKWHVQKSKIRPLAHSSLCVGWSRLYHTGHVKCLYNSCDWRHWQSSLGQGKSTEVYKERLHISSGTATNKAKTTHTIFSTKSIRRHLTYH